MPIYVYECSSCGDVFEVEQRITADPLTECHCGSAGTVKRIIQPTAVIFNGSGFYVNDSASKPTTVETPKEDPKPESTTQASTDASATPATTTESSAE